MKVSCVESEVEGSSAIAVFDRKTPIYNAHVLLIADNNTFFEDKTDEGGMCVFTGLPIRNYSVYIAHPNYPANFVDHYRPGTDLRISIERRDGLGSLICSNSTGYIPNFQGRLNPILDTHKRTYLYASNIAIEGGKQQPVTFEIGTPLRLEDKNANTVEVVFLRIQGESSLLEYKWSGMAAETPVVSPVSRIGRMSSMNFHVRGDYVAGDKVSGDKVGRDKNAPSKGTMGFWLTILATVTATAISYFAIEGKIPAIFGGVAPTEIAAGNDVAATTTPNLASIFAQTNSMKNSVQREEFLDNYANSNVYGTATFKDISRSGQGYIVIMHIQNNVIGCAFPEAEKARLLLLQSGQSVKFYGKFTGGGLGGFGSVNPWYLTNCELLN